LNEERIASLDGDWSEFTAAERAAFAFTRRLTHAPHELNEEDVAEILRHYKPLQALEIILTVAGNNSTARWTDALGIPQERTGRLFGRGQGKEEKPREKPAVLSSFLTPTIEKFQTTRSRLVPSAGARRPALESRKRVEVILIACRTRTPRVAVVEESKARQLMPDSRASGPVPHWVRLLANFPVSGMPRVHGLLAARYKGELDRKLRAQVAWIAAREDRAWYALGQARKRLLAFGVADKDIWALDGDWEGFKPSERAAFALARKLTATPHRITDDDIALLRKHFPDRQVAELVFQPCNAAFFNRLTEAAGLPLEE
jgi:alkylhydroperoxidase family enzyme